MFSKVSRIQFSAQNGGILNSVILQGSVNKMGSNDKGYRCEFNRKNFTAVFSRGQQEYIRSCKGTRKVSRISYKSQKHRYLTFDVDFSIDIPRMSLYRTRLYAQILSNTAVTKTFTKQFRYLSFTRC